MLEFPQRRGTRCLKYDSLNERFGRDDLLPLWVADMDCKAPEVVQEVLQQRLAHGIYGYSSSQQNEACKAAICSWLAKRHGVEGLALSDCLIFAGVLEALSVCIEVLCAKDEAIILQTPAYNCFFATLAASGRLVIENQLAACGQPGNYRMDLARLEQQIQASPSPPRIFLLCSPHNPIGKVWPEDELRQLIELCCKYQIYLISDEIHFDLVYRGHRHLSLLRSEFAKLYDRLILLSSPHKTFNIPGLRSAYLVSRNRSILQRIGCFCEQFQFGDISLPGHLALEACYTRQEAADWLAEVLWHLEQNRDLLHDTLKAEFPELLHAKPQGTYLYWVDCRKWFPNEQPAALRRFFTEAGLALGWGELYHGNGWVRVNFGCSRNLLQEALELWKRASQNLPEV